MVMEEDQSRMSSELRCSPGTLRDKYNIYNIKKKYKSRQKANNYHNWFLASLLLQPESTTHFSLWLEGFGEAQVVVHDLGCTSETSLENLIKIPISANQISIHFMSFTESILLNGVEEETRSLKL